MIGHLPRGENSKVWAVHLHTMRATEPTDTMRCPLYKSAKAKVLGMEVNRLQKEETPGPAAFGLYLCLPLCWGDWPSLINPYNTALRRGKLEAENISILQIGSRCGDLVVLSESVTEIQNPAKT